MFKTMRLLLSIISLVTALSKITVLSGVNGIPIRQEDKAQVKTNPFTLLGFGLRSTTSQDRGMRDLLAIDWMMLPDNQEHLKNAKENLAAVYEKVFGERPEQVIPRISFPWLEKMRGECAARQEDLERISAQLESLKKTAIQSENRITSLAQERDGYERQYTQCTLATKTITEREQQIAQDKKSCETELATTQESLVSQKQELDAVQKEITEALAQNKKLEDNLTVLQKEMQKATQKASILTHDNQDKQKQLSDLEKSIAQVMAQHEQLDQKVAQFQQQVQQQVQDLAQRDSTITALTGQNQELTTTVNQLKSAQIALEKQYAQITGNYMKARDTITALDRDHDLLSKRFSELERDYVQLQKMNDNLTNVQEKNRAFLESQQKLGFVYELYRTLRDLNPAVPQEYQRYRSLVQKYNELMSPALTGDASKEEITKLVQKLYTLFEDTAEKSNSLHVLLCQLGLVLVVPINYEQSLLGSLQAENVEHVQNLRSMRQGQDTCPSNP